MAARDDDREDIAEEKEGKKKKKAPKAKKEKPKDKGKITAEDPAAAPAETKNKKPKKEHPAAKAALLVSVFWLFAMLTFAFFAYIDLFSVKQIVLQFLSPDVSYDDIFASEIRDLEDQQLSLDMRSLALDQTELELTELQAVLKGRESELDEREMALAEKYPWADAENAQAGAEPIDISSVVKSIESMDAAKAAEAFTQMADKELGAKLLGMCRAKQAGAILSAMAAEDASSYLEMMGAPAAIP